MNTHSILFVAAALLLLAGAAVGLVKLSRWLWSELLLRRLKKMWPNLPEEARWEIFDLAASAVAPKGIDLYAEAGLSRKGQPNHGH